MSMQMLARETFTQNYIKNLRTIVYDSFLSDLSLLVTCLLPSYKINTEKWGLLLISRLIPKEGIHGGPDQLFSSENSLLGCSVHFLLQSLANYHVL